MLSNLCGKLNESDVDKTNELHFVENLNDLKLRITRNCFSGNLINEFYDSNKNIKSVSDCAPLDESLSFDCNCDNKITTNHCKSANKPTNKNFYSKLYDQSLNQINVSNKIERKRNINMMLLDGAGDGDGVSFGSTQLNENALNSHGSDPKKRKLNGVSDSTVSEGDAASSTDTGKEKMYQLYQPWVLKTYGDQAKTKTITLKKQTRIIYALKGLESNKPDSSKFRFWVKSKGFMMELPAEYKNLPKYQENINDGCLLYVPSKSDTNNIMFKRVAVVEYFFNIIYKVHCSVIGEGRHVGQKRTYRKIQESYSFLPREAVTKFLSQCFECRRTLRTTNLIPDIKEEISEDKDINNQSLLSSATSDNTNNIENYYLLLKALYENSIFNKAKSGHIDVQSSEKKFESFKENIYSNQDTNSNQQIYHKNININMNLKNESENLIKENENLGNIIINSLDVSINVGKAQNNYGNVNKVRISCTTTPTKSNLPNANNNNNIDDQHLDEKDDEVGDKDNGGGQSNQQLDIVSSSCIGDKEDPFDNGDTQQPTTSADTIQLQQQYECKKQLSKYDGDDNLTTSNIISMTRAVYNHREDKFRYPEIPDDTGIDYHNIKEYYDDGKTSIKMKSNATETNNCPLPKYQPITSTYLLMTRSMGLSDEDALNLDSISAPNENNEQTNLEDSYANLLKDADKLKLMLLAWNYQNSAAVRNNTTGPDLATMSNLWEQYQSALAMSTKPINEQESLSPTQSQDEANSPSDVKEEDEGSEDESDDRIDHAAHDPERLKAFNMFVRMFVDENLDRMVPISKQPKEKVQAIIDSCTRQFPEFAERARKRLRTYLKSCRRNKKTKDGWENQPSRPTPAHLTSVQAEQILAIACENESMNAKRMRIGLEPITQSITIPSTHTSESGAPMYTTAKSVESITTPLSITTNIPNCKTSPAISTTTDTNANSISSILNSSRTVPLPSSTPYNLDFNNGFGSKSVINNNNTSGFYNPTSMTSTQTQGTGPTDLSVKRPLLPHKLNVTEAAAVKQLITGYRESAAFLLRSADELEQLLLNQQQ